ncbi:MAG TPA: acetolactate synthase small subunit [Candidatus Paceibacterota bacterium]
MNERILVALVQDRSGVLEEVVSLFRRRGFNIKSVAVGSCEKPGLSRMTIVVETKAGIEQARKQLERLIPVVEAFDLTGKRFASQETVLIKVEVKSNAQRSQILQLVNTFGAKIVATEPKSLVVGLMGEADVTARFTEALKNFNVGIEELARSGLVAVRMEG